MHRVARMMGATLRALRPLLCAGLLSAIAGCSWLPSTASDIDTLLPGPPIKQFQIRGRVMIRHEQRIDHFRFSWHHEASSDDLLITAPFGQGLAQVLRTESGATLQWPDGRIQHAPDLPTLAVQLFGQPIPLDEIAQWLSGAYAQRSGQIDGWQVAVESTHRYTSPDTYTTNHILPKTLRISRNETLLRLVIDDQTTAP